ncbi:unnamed protein product [Polarella glacialis]|uniref:Uncharacterized protein n=1 Tax=Polarella glacialis TaxID=89957 RepID=A0A813G0F9_POLGL|nr:unnamed protein product [Polarella glacialis]
MTAMANILPFSVAGTSSQAHGGHCKTYKIERAAEVPALQVHHRIRAHSCSHQNVDAVFHDFSVQLAELSFEIECVRLAMNLTLSGFQRNLLHVVVSLLRDVVYDDACRHTNVGHTNKDINTTKKLVQWLTFHKGQIAIADCRDCHNRKIERVHESPAKSIVAVLTKKDCTVNGKQPDCKQHLLILMFFLRQDVLCVIRVKNCAIGSIAIMVR